MVKPEWGTKRTCPEMRDPLLRPRQGRSRHLHRVRQCLDARACAEVQAARCRSEVAVAAPEKVEPSRMTISAAEELVPDEDEEPSADDEVDLTTGDDDLGVATGDEDEEH